MRSSSLLLMALVAGCAHAPAMTSSVTSLVSSSAESCARFAQDQSLLLTVRNAGPGDLPPDFRASLNLVESVSQEDGHEEAIHRRADHRLPQGSDGWHASQAAVPQARLQ